MAEASTTARALTEDRETEEMDNQELLRILRSDMSAAERRTDRRFEEVKQEIAATEKRVMAHVDQRIQAVNQRIDEGAKAVNQRIDEGAKAVNQRIDAVHQRIDEGAKAVNQRIDDLRDYIDANRLFKNNWRTFVVAGLATAAVVGTFVLQLMEAIR
ncbi:MAG: hypothetical protein OXS50_05525 [Gammaproteobacteria bacterium]|nr:hypothetical protein [Gammaproteobacteria bacterium]